MRAEVRDDIISLDTFVKARFYYEKYIDDLHQAGGYCFLDQWIQHYGGKNKGRYLAEQLEESGLIKTKALNNYKYCYLTDAALKYLKYKDDPRDFSKIKKANIPIKKLSSNPSEKVLMSSAIKFALMQKYEYFRKDVYVDKISSFYSKLIRYLIVEDKVVDNKIIFGDDNENLSIDKRVKKIVDKSLNYFDKSKIVFYPVISKKNEYILNMIILDTGTNKSASSYLENLLNDYLKCLDESIDNKKSNNIFDFNQLIIAVASYDEERSKKIVEEINREKNKRLDKLKYILTEERKYIQPELFRVKKIIAGKIKDCYYMKHYIDRIAQCSAYLKKKDIDTFAKLKEQLEYRTK